MKKQALIPIIIIASIIFIVGIPIASFYNKEVSLRNTFTQKMDERTAFYDKMSKTITQKSQVAVKNDASFRENVDIIMAGRKDTENLTWKWLQEINPNANYDQVAALYADLSRSIEGQRAGFFEQEKVLQDVVKQHSNLLDHFPNNFINNTFFNKDKLDYTPIRSTTTKEVMETGIDDNVDLGL